jgi:hypothetical protein
VNTWTDADLTEMVDNFTNLRQRGILPNVPVRVDHSYSMRDVIGWFLSIYTDPAEPGFLFADIEFTEPDAKQQYERRTLRNRSIEIGAYETNEGEKFKNVVIGLAFVDLPAVEGLFRSPNAPTSAHSASGDQSPSTGSAPTNQGDPVTTNKEPNPGTAAQQTLPTNPPPAGSPPAVNSPTPVSGAGDGNQFTRQPAHPLHTFRVGGVEVQDFARVQAHIDALETFQSETINHTRTSFVESLAAGPAPRITNPMKESFSALVLTMTPAQFDAFRAGWEAAPPVPMTGQIPTGDPAATPAPGAAPTEVETFRAIVKQHRLSGMSEEQVATKDSYKRLMALTNGQG